MLDHPSRRRAARGPQDEVGALPRRPTAPVNRTNFESRTLEHVAFGWNQTRHCERSEAIQRTSGPYVPLDCFVANAPRNDDSKSERLSLGSKPRTGDASPRAAPESRQASPLKPVNSNLFKIAAVVRLQDRVLQGELSPLDPLKIFPQGGGVRLARR